MVIVTFSATIRPKCQVVQDLLLNTVPAKPAVGIVETLKYVKIKPLIEIKLLRTTKNKRET